MYAAGRAGAGVPLACGVLLWCRHDAVALALHSCGDVSVARVLAVVEDLRDHIRFEERMLFPAIEPLLQDAKTRKSLAQALFDRREAGGRARERERAILLPEKNIDPTD